jgi:hypothetical protein
MDTRSPADRAFRFSLDSVSGSSLEGWALGPNGTCQVEVLVDGRVVGHATTGLARPDVAAALQLRGSEGSGFAYAFKPEDFGDSAGERAQVGVRLVDDDRKHDSESIPVPRLRPASEISRLPRSPFPPSISTVLLRASAALRSQSDLTKGAAIAEALELLKWLATRAPRPLEGLHRYLAYLRSLDSHGRYVDKYFPRTNLLSGSQRDLASVLTGLRELLPIAHHLYVLADSGVPGGLLEFGCYKGFSTAVLSFACRQLGLRMEVFDSFSGLPEVGSTYYIPGDFTGTLDEVTGNVSGFGASDCVTFHKGFFSESVPRWTRKPAACIWMDVDLERSVQDTLPVFGSLDVRGALFSHECIVEDFQDGRVVVRRGSDHVVGAIVDGFVAARGVPPTGTFIAHHTGAFWSEATGIPVLGADAVDSLLALARAL